MVERLYHDSENENRIFSSVINLHTAKINKLPQN